MTLAIQLTLGLTLITYAEFYKRDDFKSELERRQSYYEAAKCALSLTSLCLVITTITPALQFVAMLALSLAIELSLSIAEMLSQEAYFTNTSNSPN